MWLQVQIGADPRNTLFAYCTQYKEDTELLWFIVGGAIGAAVLLVIVILAALYCVRRRRNRRTRRPSYVYTQQELDNDRQMETSFRDDVGLRRRYDSEQLPAIPRVVLRPLSLFPDDDEPAPTSNRDRRLRRNQNTQSIYPTQPTDDEDYSRTIPDLDPPSRL